MNPNSVIAALRVAVNGESVCGGCGYNVQLSGQCHMQACANQTQIALVKAAIVNCIPYILFYFFLKCLIH